MFILYIKHLSHIYKHVYLIYQTFESKYLNNQARCEKAVKSYSYFKSQLFQNLF